MSAIPKSDDIGMPMIGFGTWKIPNTTAESLVSSAIKVCYTHFDCADEYSNEAVIGKAFERVKNRQDLYIASKPTDNAPHLVRPAFLTTLENLKLDYLDLYLIHYPFRIGEDNEPLYCTKGLVLETWREMIKLKETERVKRIGVSNFTAKKLQWILDEEEKPANNQIEIHPYFPRNDLIKFCKDRGIVVSAYSPLGTPNTVYKHINNTSPDIPKILDDPMIIQIAKNHLTTPAQVLLKWNIMRECPVLVKSSSKIRMKENLDSLKVELTQKDMTLIGIISTRYLYVNIDPLVPKDRRADDCFEDEYFNE